VYQPVLEELGQVGADALVGGDGVFRTRFVQPRRSHGHTWYEFPENPKGRFCGIGGQKCRVKLYPARLVIPRP
jgi:hypothetical protein